MAVETAYITTPGVSGRAEVVKIGGSIDPTTGATGPMPVSDGAYPKTDRSITASTTSQQAAPENLSRRRILMQNLDAAINVHVNLGDVATTGLGSLRLAPGSSVEFTGTSQAVNVIAVSGTPLVTIWEF